MIKKLGHLRLSKTTKQSVAEKLKEGVSVRHIIDGYRDSEIGQGIIRDHLITEKDINNKFVKCSTLMVFKNILMTELH